jgi:hypothetical protein
VCCVTDVHAIDTDTIITVAVSQLQATMPMLYAAVPISDAKTREHNHIR